MSFLDMFKYGSAAQATPSGSSIAGYSNLDLSGFTPGAAAPALATPPALPGGESSLLGALWKSAFDSKDANGILKQGWLSPAIGIAQGIGNGYMGMKQYGLARDSLKEQQRQFNMNYENQRKLTNSMLEDRQRARVASNPGAYQSPEAYLKQYGV